MDVDVQRNMGAKIETIKLAGGEIANGLDPFAALDRFALEK